MEHADLQLIRPTAALRDAFEAFRAAFIAAGEMDVPGMGPMREPFDAGLEIALTQARGVAEPGFVPASLFWLVEPSDAAAAIACALAANDGETAAAAAASVRILGTLHLRHRLNDRLLAHGGHIGYAVRPDARGRGLAKRMLAMGLEEARRLGLSRVLVTCLRENIASASVIRANGGVLADERQVAEVDGVIQRYWITLRSNASVESAAGGLTRSGEPRR